MKTAIFLFLALFCGSVCSAQSTPAEGLARRISQKMKDSLILTPAQADAIFGVNMQLHNQKLAARSQYANRDSLTTRLQVIENTRDSLYATQLTAPQYQLYKQKKRSLVSNNSSTN